MSAHGNSQKQQYIHDLKHDITIAPFSLVPAILHELLDYNIIKEPFIWGSKKIQLVV